MIYWNLSEEKTSETENKKVFWAFSERSWFSVFILSAHRDRLLPCWHGLSSTIVTQCKSLAALDVCQFWLMSHKRNLHSCHFCREKTGVASKWSMWRRKVGLDFYPCLRSFPLQLLQLKKLENYTLSSALLPPSSSSLFPFFLVFLGILLSASFFFGSPHPSSLVLLLHCPSLEVMLQWARVRVC